MTFKEFVPASYGVAGDTLVASGTNLQSVSITDADADVTIKYSSLGGCNRDSVGISTIAPDAADIARATLLNTADVAGKIRVYGFFSEIPAGTAMACFFRMLNTAATPTQVIRMSIAPLSHATLTPGTLQIQNSGGGSLANGPVLNPNQVYQFILGAQPGTTSTTGKGRAELYDDNDALLMRLANSTSGTDVAVAGGNIDAVNMGTTQSVAYASVGKIDGSGGAPIAFHWTRLASDFGSAIPASLPLVSKIAPPPVGSTTVNFPGTWVGDAWRAS